MPPQSSDPNSPLGGPLELPEDSTAPPASRPTPPPSPHDPRPRGKKIFVIILVMLLLAAAGVGAWMFLKKKPSPEQAQSNQVSDSTPKVTEPTASTATKTYTNDRMRLSIDYPDNWTVTEADSAVRIESPDFTYTTVDKGEVTGNFRLYMRQGAQASDSSYIGKGVAILPSEKIAYTKPTTNQRKETFLSSFGLTTENNFAFFLIAGNFELKKGDTLGPNYGKEIDTYIIGGGYSAKDLADGLQTNLVPVDEFQQSTAYKQAVDALKSIQIK